MVNATPRPHYPRVRPGTHSIGDWVGLTAGLDGCGKSRPHLGFDPRTVQPVASNCYATCFDPIHGLSSGFEYQEYVKGNACTFLYTVLSLILRRSRTGTVWFYNSTSNKRAARPKLYTKSLTRDLKRMYSRLTLVRISIKL